MPEKVTKFDKEKFKQVLHYIIHKCGSIENVGKTVLFKMLYFSDFNFYETYEKSITGETYIKLPRGPAPSHFDEIVDKLSGENKIRKINAKYMGKTQKSFISQEEPDISKLSANEIKVIDGVMSFFSSMNASRISAYSHGDMPWKATKENKTIDYELVFYRNEFYSVCDDDDY